MNGKVNGTMENPIDTSAPNPPDTLQNENEKEASSEGCENATNPCENSNHTEDSNHLDSESSQGGTAQSNTEDLENDTSNGSDSHEHDPLLSTEDPEVTENEKKNIIFVENNCGNSNESFTEPVKGRQVKSDANDETLHNIMVQKNQEAEEARALGKVTTTITGITEITQDEISDIDTDVELTDDEDIFEGEILAEDTVSINSDDVSDAEEITDETQDIKDNNIIILENEDGSFSQNGTSHDSPSPEVQEIVSDNDDCVVAEENQKPNSDNKVQLRRSSRAIKRKRYNDDVENGGRESDIEDVASGAHQRKMKPIVINNTKALVEMAARQLKSNQNHTQKKEPTVVIIDTNKLSSEKSAVPNKPSGLPISSSLSAQSLYQSIVARGTTVTPVSSKSNAATQSTSQAAQPSILPSLTDDMFVVEAPSFIVPYVYEKPSVKPFREFVDLLGKELDEQKAKEEKELEEKQKEEKEKIDKDKEEKKEKGEDVQSEEEAAQPPPAAVDAEQGEQTDDKKKKKKEKRKRGAEEDDVSWDGSTTTDSEDEILISDEENKTIIIKDKADSMQEIKDISGLIADKVSSTKSDNYFDCSLGKFFINIGLSLVQEYVQSDLLKQQNRKLNREKKSGNSTKMTESSIASLKKNIEFSRENNAPYSFPQKKCEFCSFKTESSLAMFHHLETPHMKNNVYKCNFCAFEIRSPHDILYHMEAEHNTRGKLERAPAYHQCPNCVFEDNGKGKLARHLIPCAKKFKPETNLAPSLEWEPPAKIPKITRSRNSMKGSYQNMQLHSVGFNQSSIGSSSQGRQSTSVSGIMPGVSSSYRPRGRGPMSVPGRSMPVHGVPILRGGVMVRHNAPGLMSSNYPAANNAKSKSAHQPSISITPLPRQPPPVQLPPPAANAKSSFVICEICDGYIKDLEQLRNHMQWIHKVKIHPKMIYNRPPLNCQKCQFRFFTDQGLERHLLGSHGLVTSSMQEAANKGKDAGRCPVCGRVYQWKLLNHVARDHNLTLKPAHLSYKCTVCTATFGMYKQFENHVYSAHSVVAKRVMDKSKSAAPAKTTNNQSLLKPLKINDEITIIPQPVKAASGSTDDAD